MAGIREISGEVLVAEDDPAALELVRTVLTDAGYDTRAAASGDEAIAHASEHVIGAAVLDVNLPGRSGYEVCRELRRVYGAAVPILFLSGERTESFDRIGGLLLGADDYLVKPFDPDDLLTRLSAALVRARGVAEARLLTPRELEVLTLLSDGLAQREIAALLGITSKTVATHIERILGKLGVRSRAQAVAFAFRETLVAVSA